MLKNAFIFLLGLMFFQSARAQKADSVLLYVTNQSKVVETKDSADYYLQVMTPPDSSTGIRINRVKEFYLNKQPKLIGDAQVYIFGRRFSLLLNGPCIEYYANGHKKSLGVYKRGVPVGNTQSFYPNGHIYSLSSYDKENKLIECRDSTGKVLAKNGGGEWIKFDNDFKHKTEEGMITDSLEEGEWQTFNNDSAKYTLVYKHGMVISSTEPGWENRVFAAVQVEPQFKNGGPQGFKAFLAKAVVFPDIDRRNGTQGRVIATFIVEKDGTLSDIKVLRSPSPSMADAAVQAIELSPRWMPGTQNDKPVRVQFTIAFAFSLAGK